MNQALYAHMNNKKEKKKEFGQGEKLCQDAEAGLGVVVHVSNPSYLGGKIGGSQFKACLGKIS
jgi:hypothetical protein